MLMAAGIRLQDRPDLFLWTGGDQSGTLTAKNVYQALTTFYWPLDKTNRFQQLWKANCPLKLKLFTWLLIENRVLVWPNLQARGWEGPSRCYLCLHQSESISHLFIFCPFVRVVWQLLVHRFFFTRSGRAPMSSNASSVGTEPTLLLHCCQFTSFGRSGNAGMLHSSMGSLHLQALWRILSY
jgi:hypothetical protein